MSILWSWTQYLSFLKGGLIMYNRRIMVSSQSYCKSLATVRSFKCWNLPRCAAPGRNWIIPSFRNKFYLVYRVGFWFYGCVGGFCVCVCFLLFCFSFESRNMIYFYHGKAKHKRKPFRFLASWNLGHPSSTSYVKGKTAVDFKYSSKT